MGIFNKNKIRLRFFMKSGNWFDAQFVEFKVTGHGYPSQQDE